MPDEERLTLSEDLLPPLSSATLEPETALTVTISAKAVLLEEDVVAEIKQGVVDASVKRDGASGFIITPLLAELQKQAIRLRRISEVTSGKMPFKGELRVMVHRTTNYRLLSEVLYTAGQAEFGKWTILTLRQKPGHPTAGGILVDTPHYDAAGAGAKPTLAPKDAPPLNLTVVLSYKGHIVARSGGIIKGRNGSPTTIPCKKMDGKRCAWSTTANLKHPGRWSDGYDHEGLTRLVTTIKTKFPNERKVIVTADRLVPVQVVVRTLDALRGKHTAGCTGKDGCLFDQVQLAAGVQ